MHYVLTLVCVVAACGGTRSHMKTDNANLVRTLFVECFNRNDTARLAQIVSPDFTGGPNGPKGPAAFAGVLGGLRAAFPDLTYTIEDMVTDGDRVAVRWTWHGTHEHAFRKHPPTKKRISNTGTGIFQITNGKIARGWIQTDRLGFLEEIEALHYDPN